MVCPKLEYTVTVWAPHKKKSVWKLEKIQRVVAKMVPKLKDLSYKGEYEEIGFQHYKRKEK